ncbi:MAG: hypothetical protein K8R68_06725, partial [Bacteroidales bacterium]|nr:hypothetical protein [Bacteroidales bacterium]
SPMIIESLSRLEIDQCKICGEELYDLILPPGENKIIEEDLYHNKMYSETEKVLKSSSSWVIIGYSFPEYDNDILKIFQNALADKKWKYKRNIAIVSPDAKSIAKRLAISLNHPVIPVELGFSGFVDYNLYSHGLTRPGIA